MVKKNLCVKLTDTISGIFFYLVIFYLFFLFPIMFTLFFEFLKSGNKITGFVKNLSLVYKKSNMALRGVQHGSARSPSWLWEKSVRLGGSMRNLSKLW